MTRAKDTAIRYLTESRGMTEIASKSRKYRAFRAPGGQIYHVGKQGAVRVGKSVSASMSVTKVVTRLAENWEDGR